MSYAGSNPALRTIIMIKSILKRVVGTCGIILIFTGLLYFYAMFSHDDLSRSYFPIANIALGVFMLIIGVILTLLGTRGSFKK